MTTEKLSLPAWPHHSAEEIEIVTDILKSGKTNALSGEHCSAFEQEFANYCGCQFGLAVANGTIALEILLQASGIGTGDEVIVPSRTFLATASAVARVGAVPVFCDIDPASGNIDVAYASSLVSTKTRAILCVHLAGWPCDMVELSKIAKSHNLLILEDCSQAHGAEINGQSVGSFGDGAAWSFCFDKNISTGGEGGMITTNNPQIAELARSLYNHGEGDEELQDSGFVWKRERIGTNGRLTEIQAAIGRYQLSRLDEWIDIRNRNSDILSGELDGSPLVRLNVPSQSIRHARYRFVFHYLGDRKRLLHNLGGRGIHANAGGCPEVYREKAFAKIPGIPLELKAAHAYGKTAVAIPVHPTLSADNIHCVAECIAEEIIHVE